MTLIDALKQLTTETWIRPVSWRKRGQAFTLRDDATIMVPDSHGGTPYMTNQVSALVDDWEVVEPYTVLHGQ